MANKSVGTLRFAHPTGYDRSGALVYTDSVDTAGASNSTVTTTTDYLSLGRKTIAEIATRTTVTPPAGMTNNICATVPSLCITTTTITSKHLHSDLLGSPRKATDASRNLLWQEHFDPYGQKLNGANEKLGYTGHAFDPESGFTYMQARFYDPLVGRFLSTDPVYFKDEDPFTFNRYAYANNNPYKFTDPFGLSSKSIPDDNAKRGIGSNVAGALASSAKSYNFSGGDWTVAGGAASGSGNKQNSSSGAMASGSNQALKADNESVRNVTYTVQGKTFNTTEGVCGTAECLLYGANKRFDAPENAAYYEALQQKQLKDSNNIATVLGAFPLLRAAQVGTTVFDIVEFSKDPSLANLLPAVLGGIAGKGADDLVKAGTGSYVGASVELSTEAAFKNHNNQYHNGK